MSHIFSVVKNLNSDLESLYRRSLDELNEFTHLNWIHSLPHMYVMDRRDSIDAWNDRTNTRMSGWTYGSHQFYVLAEEEYRKEEGNTCNEGDYFKLIKHEMAHCFYQVLTNGVTNPVWLWEGFAVYASGQVESMLTPRKLSRFLASTDHHESGVYEESGHVIKLLDNVKGRSTLINFVKKHQTSVLKLH